MSEKSASVRARVLATSLLAPDRSVVVLLSGGRDSVCLLDLAADLLGAGSVSALHVNYGLRDAADEDEAFCAELCARLGVALEVRSPRRPSSSGNLQAWARDQRYAAAAQLALAQNSVVATGHTATDQVETVLYRLAASPGRRALLGMPARSGRLVRPLLDVTREETAACNAERGLEWREDETNASSAFARGRVRHDLLEALKTIHPAAEANLLATSDILRDEAEVLDGAVDAALRGARDAARGGGHDVAALAALPPALRRLALQTLAERAVGAPDLGVVRHDPDRPASRPPAPAVGPRADEILELGRRGGSAALDLGGGLRAVVEYGSVRLTAEPTAATPGPVTLSIPGQAAFGTGELSSHRGAELALGDPERTATLDGQLLASQLEVRSWRPGDRLQPLGLEGTKTLQDLFGDRRVPRERRAQIPVVTSAGEIAWVPGVATAERFKVTPRTRERVRLGWRP